MSQRSSQLGATPGKLALVGVLAVVMIAVVASNWTGAPTPPAEPPAVAAAPLSESLPTPATPPTAPAGPFGEFAQDAHWPETPVQEVTEFDPFAPAKWAVVPAATGEAAAHDEEQINELLAAENAIIFVAGNKRLARIGEHDYQIGDVIGRFQISDISAQGVTLSEAK